MASYLDKTGLTYFWNKLKAYFATPPKTASVTIPSSGRSGNDPYTHALTMSGVTSNDKIDIQPNAAAIAQLMADEVTALYIENNNGTLTAYALGAVPTTNLTLQVTIMGVS